MEIRSKPLELCKTRIKSSSLDMLNFYVISVGRDMVDDTDKSATPPSKSELHHYKEKLKKLKGLPKIWVSPNNCLIFSDRKLKSFTFGIREQKKGAAKPLRQQLKMDLVTRKK